MRDEQPKADADIQRKVARKLLTVLNGIIGEVESFEERLAARLEEGFAENDPCVFARQAPRDSRTKEDEARSQIWHEGIFELKTRFSVALDTARTLRTLCGHDAGLVLAPLVVVRPALEAAVDTRVYIGGKPHDDRVARFYAGMVRDMSRVSDPMVWKRDSLPSGSAAMERAVGRWTHLRGLAEQAGLRLVEDSAAEDAFGKRVLSVQGRGKKCQVQTNVSSLLGSEERDLLQAWQLTSGAVHGATWLASDNFYLTASGQSAGAPWANGGLVIAQALGWICDLHADFLGLPDGYRSKFTAACAKAILSVPDTHASLIFGMQG